MTSTFKLAPARGTLQRLHVSGLASAARRAWDLRGERSSTRPLRDIDGWSDQAETAFVEEHASRRFW